MEDTNMHVEEEPRAITLTPPSIYDAMDGGLGYDDIARNPDRIVVVSTGPWGDIKAGDRVEILWGPGLDVVATHQYETGQELAPQVKVPAAALSHYGEGYMPLAAQITLSDRDIVYRTPVVEVLVKLSVPGGLDPDPETPSRNESLARPVMIPSTLPDDLEGIVVEVPPYLNMAEGDRVTLQWQTVSLRYGPLTAQEVRKPVRFEIDKATASATSGGEVAVRYQVHDRVANWSLWSPVTTVDVPPGDGAPPSPWVLGTVRDEGKAIDLADVGDRDVVVRVEGHPGVPGDEVVVVWQGVTENGKPVSFTCPPATVQRRGQTIEAVVPNDKVTPLVGGQASVSYSMLANGDPYAKSQRRRLIVKGRVRPLPEPSIAEASGGVLDPLAASAGVHVVVKAWDGVDADDRCYLEWNGTNSHGDATFYHATLTGADIKPDRTLVFTVPAEEAVRIAGGSLRVRYAISVRTPVRYPDGVRNEPLVHLVSPWLELTVAEAAVPLSIDSTPATLSGPIVRLEKRVTVPPVGAFVARVATGGVPPYRYSAASGAVEVDEATGRVVSLRNGEAVVTVTDAKGATASYPVKVSGVLHFLDLNSNSTFSTAGPQASSRGARLPSLAEWDALRAAYGGSPDMRQDAGWSSQQYDAKSHYVVYPATGTREVRKTFGLGAPLGLAWAWGVFAPTA